MLVVAFYCSIVISCGDVSFVKSGFILLYFFCLGQYSCVIVYLRNAYIHCKLWY